MRIWETCKVYNDPDRVEEFLIKQTTSSPFTSVTCIVKVKLHGLLKNPRSKICVMSGSLAAFISRSQANYIKNKHAQYGNQEAT